MSGVLETLTLLLMLMLLLLLLSNDLSVGTSVVYLVVVERRIGADVLDDVPGMIFERQMSLSCCE